jgi:hypothetical protein
MTPRQTQQHDPDRCKMTYVSWMWLVGILIIAAGAASRIVWDSAERMTNTEHTVKELQDGYVAHDNRIHNLEAMTRRDLDSIKAWTRPNYRR